MVHSRISSVNESDENDQEYLEPESDTSVPSSSHYQTEDLQKVIEQIFAAALLKLEHLVHVPGTAVDVFLEELCHLICSAPVPLSCDIVRGIFQQRNVHINDLIIRETVDALSFGNPVQRSIQKGGPLSTVYLRKQYYKQNFSVVEPVEYILDAKNKRTFQYVPVLKSLQQLLSRRDILDKVVEGHPRQEVTCSEASYQYKSSRDGSLFKENIFFTGEKPRIILNLYVDDFETCNPLGTSRKIHKRCAVYWILANLPPGSHSSLSSIYLAALCKSDDVKTYGFDKVFEPLVQDLKTLEELGVYVPQLV